VGHAGAYPFRRSAGDEHPQPEEPALAALAGTGKSLRRSRDVVLRVRRYETAQDADLVRPCRGTSAVCFPGLWTPRKGVRGPKSAPVEGDHELFGFLTTEANAVVAPIHEKAMPVILTTPDELDLWLQAKTPNALALQKPLADDALRIVAKGERKDRASLVADPQGG
jgi:putative SOS response-associated peptidase YedK